MCLIFHKDEMLLMKAAAHKDFAGHYNPLGGHVEKGEDIVASAKREILEESGLRIDQLELTGVIHVSSFYGKEIMMFVMRGETEERAVRANEEGELEWVKVAEVAKLPILEDVKPIIQKVLEQDNGEVFTAVSRFDGDGKLVRLEFTK
jgi:8-oxo-dGTP diphosphatase